MANQQHPSARQLHRFAQGRLSGSQQDTVAEHVADCQECCAVLAESPDDALVGLLRSARSGGAAETRDLATPTMSDETPGEIPEPLRDHARYRVIKKLGAGGMGEVYLAEHRIMGRLVVLKILKRELLQHPTALERFRREVQTAASLAHQNIVTSHDADEAGGLHFLVMEYIDGVDLAGLVARNGPLQTLHACHYVRQAARGLQHAFEHGMVHRDIKPQNLMLDRRGRVRILDFGLARWARQSESDEVESGLTAAGTYLGTPDYMAPEQSGDSRQVDIRSDIYSLGCTLYFLLAGQPPFPRGSPLHRMMAHANHEPTPLAEFRQDVPDELVQVIDRMMAKDREQRYSTPAEVADALARIVKALRDSKKPPLRSAVTAAEPPPPPRTTQQDAETVALAEAPCLVAAVDIPQVVVPAAHSTVAGSRSRRRPNRAPLYAVGAGLALLGVLACFAFWPDGTPSEPRGRPIAKSKTAKTAPAVTTATKTGSGKTNVQPVPAGRGSRVLIVMPNDQYWYDDYEPVRRILTNGNATVQVAAPTRNVARPYEGHPEWPEIQPDVALGEARAEDFDAVVFIGGKLDELLGDTPGAAAAGKLVRAMQGRGKYVTSLCAGNNVLAELGVLDGKQAANAEFVRAEFRGGPIEWNDVPFQSLTSERIITGGDYRFAEQFAQELLRQLDR